MSDGMRRRNRRTGTVTAGWAAMLGAALVLVGCTQPGTGPSVSQPQTLPPDAWVRGPSTPAPEPAEPVPGVGAAPAPPSGDVGPGPASYPPAPQPPQGYDGDDLLGAERAAMHFLNLYAYTFQTGNTAPLEAMSGPDCTYCQGVIENALSYVADGQVVTGGDFQFDSVIAFAPHGEYDFYTVRAEVTQLEIRVLHKGEVVEETSATPVLLSIGLNRKNDGWQVEGVGVPEQGDS